jgi:type IV secretion/conjugal transfer VirB4 family ATPase
LKKKTPGFCDLLNYAHFVEEGIILNKDGAFLITYQYHAPDLDSGTPEALDALVQLINRMLLALDDGWMLHVDEIRLPVTRYPVEGHFPDPVSRLIDRERAALYREEGMHFENHAFITFVLKFPLQLARKTRYLFVDGLAREPSQHLGSLLTLFIETVERQIALLSSQLQLKKLTSSELMAYLTACIQGEVLPVCVPPQGCYLDVALSRNVLVGGYAPKVGEKYLQVLSLLGYLNSETMPGLLREVGTYPLVYRWSNRFIPLSQATAEQEIKRIERNWHNKAKGLMGLLKEMVTSTSSKLNQDALLMVEEAQEASLINSNQRTRFGYWTSTLVLMHEDKALLLEAGKSIANYVEQVGFSTLLETVNALDAWRGTLPGHGSCQARRLLVSSITLAHSLPLSQIWTGQEQSSPQSLLPPGSPAVFYGVTLGKTPFRYHLDVQDVGHQVILGPTGSGKSTFLGLLLTQFLRYEGAQIFVFDKDFSHQALTQALGGYHYNIGQEAVSFAPLQALDTPLEQGRAQQFIESLVLLQQGSLSPQERHHIHQALASLRLDPDSRSLTVLANLVQQESLRQALNYYTQRGQLPLLDGERDTLQTGYLQTFEMHWLLSQKPEVYVPVLLYLFDQIEGRLEKDHAKRPTLIILEEAWLYLNHPIFVSKIRDWLKTLRKKNARVIFATQSLSDLYDPTTKTLTQVTATLLESCPTKVFLPHLKMDAEAKVLYQKMGLNNRQIDIIGQLAVPKYHYYVTTPEGSRLIHLGLKDTPIARSFLGLSKERSQQLMACQASFGEEWLTHWLTENGLLGGAANA